MKQERIEIRYRFECGEDQVYEFLVRLDAHSLDFIHEKREAPPDWTRLEVGQCRGCPLNMDEHRYCPLALSLVEIIETCGQFISYEEVRAKVTTPVRTVHTNTTAQKAVSSLLGLHMATGGCPRMTFLKPMARFHLPFATREETIFRATSAYLLAQYFLHKRGQPHDLDLGGLRDAYASIQDVNRGMAMRLRSVSSGDANVNAIVLLDLFAQEMPFAIKEGLEAIEYLFDPYFEMGQGQE